MCRSLWWGRVSGPLLLVVLLLAPLWLAPGRAGAATATIVLLAPPLTALGAFSEAHGINASGEIVGVGTIAIARDGGQTYRAIHWGTEGAATILPVPPGTEQASSDASAIGDDGAIVGAVGAPNHAVVWRGGTVTDLGTIRAGGGGGSAAAAINAAGQIVGASSVLRDGAAGDDTHAARWDGTTGTDLGTFAPDGSGASQATGIDPTGRVVGYAATAPPPPPGITASHAALWSGDTRTDLGTLAPGNGGFSAARAINAAGQIAGAADDGEGRPHAVVWVDGAPRDLGIPGGFRASAAAALNNRGQVVGAAVPNDPSKGRAYLWAGGAATDLNTLLPVGSGWVLAKATGINDAGQVVGNGTYNGDARAFLLTLPAAPPVPTPSPSPSPSASSAPSSGPPSASSFADVPPGYWAHDQITRFAQRGLTTGCDTNIYCPERGVTRAEMGVFLDRTLGFGSPATPASQVFVDVPTHYWAYAFIDQFAKLGITTGCSAGEFCPDRGVTRAEMAAFLIRALKQLQLAPAMPTFADVPTSHPQYGYIEALYSLGITTGCGTDAQGKAIYCPDRGVTRAEMAVFIMRAFP